MSNCFVYGLLCPIDGVIRYVGKTTQGLSRPEDHIHDNIGGNKDKRAWTRRLKESGLTYEIIVLEECTSNEESFDSEKAWIAYLRAVGCTIYNMTDGGAGKPGCRASKEQREKVAATLTGRKRPGLGPKLSAIFRARRARPIVDQFGVVYETQADAARILGMPTTVISMFLRGVRKSARGYTFKFVDGGPARKHGKG